MIEAILPPGVAAVETTVDPDGVVLHDVEEAAVGRAVERRRREFTTGRWCARQALAKLGVPEAPVGSGANREPLWPQGVVGAITHCTGYRAAAVARAADVAAVGIDAEPDGPCPGGVLEAVSSASERAMLADLSTSDRAVAWDRVLFSAKESVYKAWYPLTHRWLGFADAELTVEASGSFTARILAADSPRAAFPGRWSAGNGLVLTAVVLS